MPISQKIVRQTLACSSVILDQFIMGLGWGWTAPTLIELQRPDSAFQITADEAGWLSSINEAGRILGPFVSPLLVDNLGRRNTLVLVTLLYFLNWMTIVFARSVNVLCMARVLFGVANGINDVVGGIYTTENCSPTFRGIIGGIIQLSFFGAVFIEYFLASYLSFVNTAIVNSAISGMAFFTLIFSTETPYFLIMKGKDAEAEKNLMWLQSKASHLEVAEEMKNIKHSVHEEKQKQKSLARLLSSTANFKAICIVVGIYILCAASGGMTFIAYASVIFTPSEKVTCNQYTILFGIAQFLAVAISPFVVERINRRTLLVGSLIGISFSHVCSYLLLYLHNHGYHIMFYPWLIFSSVTAYGAISSLMTPASFAIKGELLPLSVRAIGSSMAVIAQSGTSFLMAKIFFPVTVNYGMESNFLIYSVMSAITTIVIFFVLPETRGKSLHEIQQSMKGEEEKNDKKLGSSCGEKLIKEVV